MMSSDKQDWGTPQDLFDELNKEFQFTLDPCASDDNHKCKKYYTEKENGLIQNWQGENVFVNPPYGREITKWVKKSHDESLKENTKVVMLIPARTDTRWFHDYIYHIAEIRFLKGRVKFMFDKNKQGQSAPFPSMIVIFDREEKNNNGYKTNVLSNNNTND